MSSPEEKSLNRMEETIRRKAATTGAWESQVLPFLCPELAADRSARRLYQNAAVRAAYPVYQRGVEESSTVDVGNHQVRGVLVCPWVGCPVLMSHQGLATVTGTLFDGSRAIGGRLVDPTEGFNPGSSQSTFRSFCIPQVWSPTNSGAALRVPLHGGFYAHAPTSTGVAVPGPVQFRMFTQVLNGGVPTAVRALPTADQDVVQIYVVGSLSTACLAGELKANFTFTNDVGVTTNYAVDLGALPAGAFNVNALQLAPALVGLAAVYFTVHKANFGSVTFARLMVSHWTATATVHTAVGLGSYVGGPVTGLPMFMTSCQSARVTALSLKITNTASMLNANGFITGLATQDTMPDCAGVYGEDTIQSFTSAKTFAFTDGSYMALAPQVNLKYSPLDSGPPTDVPFGMYIITGQDDTPISMKLEWHMLVEIISQDPTFAPDRQEFTPAQVSAIQHCQEAAGYLILSENPFHWASIGDALKKAAGVVNSGMKLAAKYGVTPAKLVHSAAKLGVPGAGLTEKLLQEVQALTRASKHGVMAVRPNGRNQPAMVSNPSRSPGSLLATGGKQDKPLKK